MNGTVSIKTVRESDRDLLWSLLQNYLYEMSYLYLDEMDGNGDYPYEHFDEYFTDPRREAYFIYEGGLLCGFAMLCPYSNLGRSPDYTMAEFTIFPSYRRKHFALDAARMILARHPGKWEIKYNEKNSKAKKLWTMVTEPFHPQVVHLNEEETVFVFENEGVS